jgi:hypothetical protein
MSFVAYHSRSRQMPERSLDYAMFVSKRFSNSPPIRQGSVAKETV